MLSNARLRALAAVCGVVLLSGFTPQDTIVRPPKFDYSMTTLDNGLQVVLLEDHSTPIVHLSMWYHVGSKNEKPGRTGFAHLFEHLMFKGSKNVQADQHPSWITSIGGQANATTDEDTTIYWQTVPAQYLPLVLWLEADRLGSLEVSEEKFLNEREVVKEERRMRVDNVPFGALNEVIFDKAFTVHPYKHQTIGSMADLEAASIDDVRGFYETFYVPNNATLTLTGAFDSKQALAMIERYFGRIPVASRCPATFRKNRFPPRSAASPCSSRGRCLRWWSGTRLPTTAIPMRTRCTSWPRCCLMARVLESTGRWCTRSAWRWPPLAKPS
jgi:predicted Zn-dependent peptidase